MKKISECTPEFEINFRSRVALRFISRTKSSRREGVHLAKKSHFGRRFLLRLFSLYVHLYTGRGSRRMREHVVFRPPPRFRLSAFPPARSPPIHLARLFLCLLRSRHMSSVLRGSELRPPRDENDGNASSRSRLSNSH